MCSEETRGARWPLRVGGGGVGLGRGIGPYGDNAGGMLDSGVRRMRGRMDPSGGESCGGVNAAVEGENCLREIANNYVEEEDGDNSSGEEQVGVARENGGAFSGRGSHGRGGRHGVVGNGTEECGESAGDSGGPMEVSSGSSGEEHSGESSEKDGEGGDEEEVRGGRQGTSGGGSRGTGGAGNGFANEEEGERYWGDAREELDDAGGGENGREATESEGGRGSGGAGGGPTLRRRRGRPLKSSERMASIRAAPITPKLEEPRAVRVNRGIKRRFPGIAHSPRSGSGSGSVECSVGGREDRAWCVVRLGRDGDGG